MDINPRSHVPVYLQIADGIREGIAVGLYSPGESLPSLRALALDVQVNPNTIQRAYDKLTHDGLVYSQRGKGLYVAEQGRVDAQNRAQQSVRQSFDQGIHTGHAVGMKAKEIRDIFQAGMKARDQGRKDK
jgi:GntR family transcriptional regulator